MSANEDLQWFVRDGLARGTSRAELGGVLAKAGWDRPEVSAALACFADLDFPVPVPRPKASLSARDAFRYLILFTTLYISAFSLGRLVFELINQAFPDPLSSLPVFDQAARAIRWSVASLMVAFPCSRACRGRLVGMWPRARQGACPRSEMADLHDVVCGGRGAYRRRNGLGEQRAGR